MLLGAQATRTAEDSGLAAAYADGGGLPVVVTGRLLRDALPSEYGARLSVAVELVRNNGRDVPLAGGLQATVGGRFVAERIADWTAGRRIRMPVLLRRAPRYLNPGTGDQARRTAWRGVALLGSVKSALLVEELGRGTRWQEAAAAARGYVRRAIDQSVGRYSARSAGVVTAVLIGDRAGLDSETRDRLQAAGTYHVIAISGGNIAILAGVLLLALRLAGVPGRIAAGAAGVGLLGYWGIVGSEPSVARATLVAVTLLAARAADHHTAPLNTLGWAALCLVAASPLVLVEVGFLLTFGATLGILIGAARLLGGRSGEAGPRDWWMSGLLWPLAGLLVATICAELALLPIAATFFSRVTAAGLLLNFAAIPLMTVAQVAGLLALAAHALSPALAAVCGWAGAPCHGRHRRFGAPGGSVAPACAPRAGAACRGHRRLLRRLDGGVGGAGPRRAAVCRRRCRCGRGAGDSRRRRDAYCFPPALPRERAAAGACCSMSTRPTPRSCSFRRASRCSWTRPGRCAGSPRWASACWRRRCGRPACGGSTTWPSRTAIRITPAGPRP